MISALDLLDALDTSMSSDEKRDYIHWIYRCQHPDGGFRMWPGTDFGDRANESNAKWDPANVPATYFALASLLVLGDDLSRVRRLRTLQWIKRMQRPDGSFGEILVDGQIQGGRDPRSAHCACGVKYILRGHGNGSLTTDEEEVEDIDIDALVRCIRGAEVSLHSASVETVGWLTRLQSFDGGIADEALHEPHAGYTFCSLGALRFVERLQMDASTPDDMTKAPQHPEEVKRWLAHLQTDLLYPWSSLDSEFLQTKPGAKLSALEFSNLTASQENTVPGPDSFQQTFIECAGFSGRLSKIADTCYAFWAGASLHMLSGGNLYDADAVTRYLLKKTQSPIAGGFGKFPGDPPDLYHSYLGLAALSLAGSEDVKTIDPAMCISIDAKRRLGDIWKRWGIET